MQEQELSYNPRLSFVNGERKRRAFFFHHVWSYLNLVMILPGKSARAVSNPEKPFQNAEGPSYFTWKPCEHSLTFHVKTPTTSSLYLSQSLHEIPIQSWMRYEKYTLNKILLKDFQINFQMDVSALSSLHFHWTSQSWLSGKKMTFAEEEKSKLVCTNALLQP